MRSAAVHQRNQRKKSLEGSGKCKVNARDMLHWSNCGRVAFLLLLHPQHHLMFLWAENTAQLCKWCNLCLCRGVPFLLPYSIIRLRETKKGKCSLIFKETYQRCVKLLNPYKKSSAYGPSPFIPPIIGFKQWEFAYWLDSFSKTFLMSTNKPFQRWIVHYKTSQTAFIPNIQSHF